jgi:CRISPR type IV-associated protein Csf3
MDPIRVEFILSGHMEIPSMPIHLDSLLAYAVYQKALEEKSQGDIRSIILGLPLGREERNGKWVWQSSALLFENSSSAGMRHWTRKTVIPDYYAMELECGAIERGRKLSGKTGEAAIKNKHALCNKDGTPKHFAQKIDTVRGSMKNDLQAYPVRDAATATAFCLGDADQIEALLDPGMGLLTHIGKRARLGHGKILEVRITPDPMAKDLWKQRILPWQENDNYMDIEANVVPPYWDATQRIQAWAHPDIF